MYPNLKVPLQNQESIEDFHSPLLELYQLGFLQKLEKVTSSSKLYSGNILFKQYDILILLFKKTVAKFYLSQATEFALADHLSTFIYLKETKFESIKTITEHQISRMLNSKHPFLQFIDVSSATPIAAHHLRAHSLFQNLHTMTQVS